MAEPDVAPAAPVKFVAAAAQFPATHWTAWAQVEDSLAQWVESGCALGARLLVFPEYASMSLPGLLPAALRDDLAGQLDALQEFREPWLALHRRLARTHGVIVLAGSFPWRLADGRTVNRAWLCTPDGAEFQDKQVMTPWERAPWGIAPGEPLRVFATALGRIGIATCYDAEFPLLVRAQAEAGAEVLLVPSCTETRHGWHRVRVAAQARALENQCHVVCSPLVGQAPWSPAIENNTGAAGLYGPPDLGFPEDGVLAQGTPDAPGWVSALVDPARTAQARREGGVRNHAHWGEQASRLLQPVTVRAV